MILIKVKLDKDQRVLSTGQVGSVLFFIKQLPIVSPIIQKPILFTRQSFSLPLMALP